MDLRPKKGHSAHTPPSKLSTRNQDTPGKAKKVQTTNTTNTTHTNGGRTLAEVNVPCKDFSMQFDVQVPRKDFSMQCDVQVPTNDFGAQMDYALVSDKAAKLSELTS